MKKFKQTLEYLKKHGTKKTVQKVMYESLREQVDTEQKVNKYSEVAGLIGALDVTTQQWQENTQTLKRWEKEQVDVQTVNWFIPRFEHVLYGGIFTIFRTADYLRTKGIQNRIIIYDTPTLTKKEVQEAIKVGFPELADEAEVIIYQGDLEALPECDASICTFWTSAYFSLKFNKTKRKFYFIQDLEPLFYSANTMYALAEMTYRFGFKAIVNTPGLEKIISERYGLDTCSFVPAVDDNVYSISDEELREKLDRDKVTLVTYGRPHHERNAFELTLEVLKRLKAKYGDKVDLISAGAEWSEDEYGVEGIVKNVGRLNSLEKVADLYRKSDIGLVFMFTPHPSYQPFEYMASGCAVVTNYNAANMWLFTHKKNAMVVEPTPAMLVENISKLIDNPVLRGELAYGGKETVRKTNWKDELETIYQYIVK